MDNTRHPYAISLSQAKWQAEQCLLSRALFPEYDYLCYRDSLSVQLRKLSQRAFTVQLLKETWQLPLFSEAKRLQLTYKQVCWTREVFLLVDDEPFIWARSVIPATTLQGKQRALKFRREKPLGYFLFKDPTLKRSNFDITHVNDYASNNILWARRSVFYLEEKPLLVNEIFLPAYWQKVFAAGKIF